MSTWTEIKGTLAPNWIEADTGSTLVNLDRFDCIVMNGNGKTFWVEARQHAKTMGDLVEETRTNTSWPHLFSGTEDECWAFLEALRAKLGCIPLREKEETP